MFFSLKKSEQTGRSTIEILGVLAVIGVLSIAGISGYTRVMEKMKIDNTINQIATVVRSIHTFYNGQKDYSVLENKSIITWDILPRDMVTGYKTLKNPFNGEVKIRSVGNGKGFVIIYNNLPPRACTAIVTSDWGDASSGITHLLISPSGYELPRDFPLYLDNGEYESSELPLSLEQATKDCWCRYSTCGIAMFYK